MDEDEGEKKKPKLKLKLSADKPDDAPSSSGTAKKKKKKDKKRKAGAAEDSKPGAKKVKTEGGGKNGKKKLKELDKAERLAHAMQSFLWWDAEELPKGYQWRTMQHTGVSFPESYQPHGVKMKYDGEEVDLTPDQEEAATFFAAMDPDGMHLGNPKTAKIFIKNFFADFKVVLGKGHVIKTFEKCDFQPIRDHLNEQKIVKKAISDAEKKANKADRDKVMFKFGYAIVDGHIEKVGNFNMVSLAV